MIKPLTEEKVIETMKLEDIPKKPIFNVPDGYFDQLPNKIQARISGNEKPKPSFVLQYRLQYVIPAVLVLVIGLLWLFAPAASNDAESILASVESEQLVAYLNESELTTEELLEDVDFSTSEVEAIESEVYELELEEELIDGLLEDLDTENL
ncbi:MAG TPA: hypothetical protein VGD40_24275 [Chryseosolibacter sp.]